MNKKMRYGLPYQGSKNQIARKIIAELPAGKRLVDLFGGGGAISHCAVLSGKYENVLYNDYNPLIVDLFRRAVNGDFALDRFTPEWISREDFQRLKDTDGYVRYVWSFGNSSCGYIYSKDIEEWNKSLHYAIVYRDFSLIDRYSPKLKRIIDASTMQERRLNCRKDNGLLFNFIPGAVRLGDLPYKYTPKCKPTNTAAPYNNIQIFLKLGEWNNQRLKPLQRLERLQTLEHIERLARLSLFKGISNLQINCGSYLDYEYQDGDVIYCDIPYEGTKKYDGKEFNHKEFYDWAYSRPYQVFFSSYDNISDKRFKIVFMKDKLSIFSATSKNKIKKETLYVNMTKTYKAVPYGKYYQYVLF